MTKRLLVIDDEADIREVVRLSLEHLKGWQITPCPSTQAFLQANAAPWDAIVLEIALYDMDGLQLFAALQTNPATQRIPVVLLTSRVMPDELQTYQQLNIAGVIAKPFAAQRLGTQIASIVGWPEDEVCRSIGHVPGAWPMVNKPMGCVSRTQYACLQAPTIVP